MTRRRLLIGMSLREEEEEEEVVIVSKRGRILVKLMKKFVVTMVIQLWDIISERHLKWQ